MSAVTWGALCAESIARNDNDLEALQDHWEICREDLSETDQQHLGRGQRCAKGFEQALAIIRAQPAALKQYAQQLIHTLPKI